MLVGCRNNLRGGGVRTIKISNIKESNADNNLMYENGAWPAACLAVHGDHKSLNGGKHCILTIVAVINVPHTDKNKFCGPYHFLIQFGQKERVF